MELSMDPKFLRAMMMVGLTMISGCATSGSSHEIGAKQPLPPTKAHVLAETSSSSASTDISSNRKPQSLKADPNQIVHTGRGSQNTEAAGPIAVAMAKAYLNNPDLNATRAGLRATDEGVPIAKAGYRPQIGISATGTGTRLDSRAYAKAFNYENDSTSLLITQQIFDGFQTYNNVKAATSDVFSGQASLRDKEISILLGAAQSYANIARDQDIVAIRRQNLAFIKQQLDATQSLKGEGEATRTDVSQVEAQLAESEALLANAVAQLTQSQAVYTQVVGDAPSDIKLVPPVDVPLARTVDEAVEVGLDNNPSIASAQYDVDAAGYRVKSAEGTLLPGVVLQGALTRDHGNLPSGSDNHSADASITVRLQVPLYQGGAEFGEIRKAKEKLGQQQLVADSARANVRQTIVTTYAQREAALASVADTKRQISAANLALSGVVAERKIGQRTTMDVLIAQQSVLSAKEGLVTSQRNATVASYTLLAVMGLLYVNPQYAQPIDPNEHYNDVKDRWAGMDVASSKSANTKIQ